MKYAPTLFACVALTLASAAPAHADDFLMLLAGEWRGGGWAQRAADAPREAVQCRFAFTVEAAGEGLAIDGQCAGGGRSGPVSGEITHLADGGYAGRWDSIGSETQDFTGSRERNTLTFHWQVSDDETGPPMTGETVWHLAGNRLVIDSAASSGGGFPASGLVLKR